MAPSIALCYFFAIFAALLNGSFLVPFKIPSVAKYSVEPLVFLQYNCFGIFLSSWLCNAFLPLNSSYVDNAGDSFQFVWLAFLGGVIFACSISCSFIAVRTIGLALSQGIFGGAAILTSYLWATIVFAEYPSDILLSIFGILILIIGVFGIALSQLIAEYIWRNETPLSKQDEKASTNPEPSTTTQEGKTQNKLSMDIQGNGEEAIRISSVFSTRDSLLLSTISREKFLFGLTFAILCGTLGGTGLVPLHYVNDSQQGLVFLPALGTGALFAAPLILLLAHYQTSPGERKWPTFYWKEVGLYGTLSGMIWNTNNIVAVAAIPQIGYGVVFPIIQCAIFIAGIWGIFVFEELRGNPIKIFFLSGGILIVGAIMLSLGT